MTIEQEVLAALIEHDAFHDQPSMVSGIARLAIDSGFDKLSPKQQGVLRPYLTKRCEGATDPGGHHNECSRILEGAEYIDAIRFSAYHGGSLCSSCRDEEDGYENQLARIMAE